MDEDGEEHWSQLMKYLERCEAGGRRHPWSQPWLEARDYIFTKYAP
jgi:hypothetical protein